MSGTTRASYSRGGDSLEVDGLAMRVDEWHCKGFL
jgi:hypothetical protein